MRESRADTARAFGLALLLHAVLLTLMFAGLWWTRLSAPPSAAGSPVSAELIDASELSAAMQRMLRDRPEPLPLPESPPPEPVERETAPPLQPIPERRPEESPVQPQQQAQEQVPIPDPIDQEAVRREAVAQEAREREQEEKRRQEQIDLTERQRQEEAERKQRLARQEQERQEQLAEIRRQREQAARETAREAQRMKQIADHQAQQASQQAAAQAPPGNDGVDNNLAARYAAALTDAIRRNWTRPDNIPPGQICRITIRQLPGGEVLDASVDPSCPYDEFGRRSVEAAVLKAQPLPYAGFERVFERTLILRFYAQGP